MEYKIILNDQQVGLLKSILDQIEPPALIYTPTVKPKELSKTEQGLKNLREYRARTKRQKNKNK